MTDTSNARWVGGFFIVATAAGPVSLALQQPILDAPAGVSGTILNTASLLELIMAAAIVAIAVAIHPILKRFSERLTLGYVIARTLEAVASPSMRRCCSPSPHCMATPPPRSEIS